MTSSLHTRIRREFSRLNGIGLTACASKPAVWLVLAAIAGLWLVFAWQITDHHRSTREASLLESKSQRANDLATSLAAAVAHVLAQQRGLAYLLTDSSEIRSALREPELQALTPKTDQDLRHLRLREQAASAAGNRLLRRAAETMDADLVYLLNASGICIASSNTGQPGDLVGKNFAFREYFRQAIAGGEGRQFAYGVTTGVSGIYLAAPVRIDGEVRGTVVVKLETSRIGPFIKRIDTFISDSDGAILAATDKTLEYSALPDSTVTRLSPNTRRERYGHETLPQLDWRWQPAPTATRVLAAAPGGDAQLLASHEIAPGWLSLSVILGLPEIERYRHERNALFLLLLLTGGIFLIAAGNTLILRRSRGQVQEALSEQSLRLDQAQRIAQLGSWQRRSPNDEVVWSDEIFAIFEIVPNPRGLSPREFLQRLHPQELPALKAAYRRLFATGQSYEISHRLVFPHGRVKHVVQRGEAIADERGVVRLYVGTIQDISVRKQMEAALRESEETYHAIFDSSVDGLAIIDPESARITACNAATLKLFGIADATQLIGQTPLRFSPPQQADGESSAQRLAFHIVKTCHEGRTSFEWQQLSNTGAPQTVMVSLCALTLHGEARILAILRDFTERKRLEQELAGLARTDVLTGLSNRRHFMELAEAELVRAKRYGEPLSLFMLDIDHFKQVNDTHGHKTGDLVLQKMAALCRSNMREVDTVARIGGEEFAVLLPETGMDCALLLAERLRQSLADNEIPLAHGLPLRITVSIGITTLNDADCNLDTLLNQADIALYRAKNDGRNQICLYRENWPTAALSN